MCPRGCEISAETGNDREGELKLSGNQCPRGALYVRQELTAPMRNIASSVLVSGGELPLASVRLTAPVPRERIFDVMAEIRRVKLQAPVSAGTVVLRDVCGLGSDVILTKTVEAV